MNPRSIFTLAAHIKTRGTAELLETCELVRLAESCEAPPAEVSAYQWAQEFALPMIRELGKRLDHSHGKSQSDGKALRELARAMRLAQITYAEEKTSANKRAAQLAEARFDSQLDSGQLSLFAEEAS